MKIGRDIAKQYLNTVSFGLVVARKGSVGALPLVSGVHKLLMGKLPDHLRN